MPKIGFRDEDILKDVGKVYKEMVYQISLVSDSRVDVKKETEQGPATRSLAPNKACIEAGSDNNIVSVVWYVNQMSMRNGLASQWSIEAKYLFFIQTGLHHHITRDDIKGISRICFGKPG